MSRRLQGRSIISGLGSGNRRRELTLAVAAILFLAVFILRVIVDNPLVAISLLYAIPVALLAVEYGWRGGLASASLAIALFTLWDRLLSAHDESLLTIVGEVSILGVVFVAVAVAVGALGDQLRRSATQRARFWELSNELLAIVGFDGYFKHVSSAWQGTLGWSAEELCSRPFIEFVHPDDREQTVAEALLLEHQAETINFENRYRCRDGSYRTFVWSASSEPADRLIYASARDMTERNAALAALRESEQFLDTVLEHLPTMVFVKDAEDLRFVRFNRAGQELLGYSCEDLVGKSDRDLFTPEQAAFFIGRDREVLEGGEPVDIPEEEIETPGGETRYLHTRKTPMIDAEGRPRYLIGISEDITDRRRVGQELAAAKKEAERANRAKSEFLSRMSHELRTPLNAIMGFGQLLELEQLEGRRGENVRHILRGGQHLLELINEVLDISQIESGTMSMSLEPVHTASVLADVLSLIRPLAEDAGVNLRADPVACDGVYVLADQQRLKQVLINLLSNAVKYNRAGGSARVSCEAGPSGSMCLLVADTGRGMDEGQLGALFTPFERLGAERSGIEGTGLGLALSRRLVEVMGGTLEADSELGRGTTMRVELAVAERPDADGNNGRPVATYPHVTRHDPSYRLTVLHIEDSPSNLALVEQALARLGGVQLISAMHGTLGLELAEKHLPDLILLDLHLPDLDGIEILRRLKRDPATAGIPVTVVSADATKGQIERLSTAGAAGYLSKPIEIAQLLGVVSEVSPPLPPADGS